MQSFAWSTSDALLGAAAAAPLVAIFVAILTWPVGRLAQVKTFCDREVVPLFAKSNWSELALISLSAGVGEEMLFRGVFQASFTQWLQGPLGYWWGVVAGLALASMLFGLLHPISLPYVGIAALLGFYIGAVWIYSGNLLTAMVTHALYDFAALGFIIRIQHGHDDESDSESESD